MDYALIHEVVVENTTYDSCNSSTNAVLNVGCHCNASSIVHSFVFYHSSVIVPVIFSR